MSENARTCPASLDTAVPWSPLRNMFVSLGVLGFAVYVSAGLVILDVRGGWGALTREVLGLSIVMVLCFPLILFLFARRKMVGRRIPKSDLVFTLFTGIEVAILSWLLPQRDADSTPIFVLVIGVTTTILSWRWMRLLFAAKVQIDQPAPKRVCVSWLALPALCLALGVVLVYSSWPSKFDSQRWQDADDTNSLQRWRMVDDLVQNYLRPGMTKEEVIAVIGMHHDWVKPNWTINFKKQMWLYTQFDKNGRLLRAYPHPQ